MISIWIHDKPKKKALDLESARGGPWRKHELHSIFGFSHSTCFICDVFQDSARIFKTSVQPNQHLVESKQDYILSRPEMDLKLK